MSIQESYCSGREELARHLLAALAGIPGAAETVQRVLWTPAWSAADGSPRFFFPPAQYRHRFDAVGFESRPLAVESVPGPYLRLQVTTNWQLALSGFKDFDSYFEQLSPKNRKKLRWLQNVYARERVEFQPVRTEEGLEEFLRVFERQWPANEWGGRLKEAFFRVYLELEKAGRNRSYLLKDPSGATAAAALGYLTGKAYNLQMLTRREGVMDKFSPGFFLTFWLLQRFFTEDRPELFLFGPGEFEYKKSFLAQPLPVYRYEARTWRNIGGIVRLYNRCRKERRKKQDVERSASL